MHRIIRLVLAAGLLVAFEAAAQEGDDVIAQWTAELTDQVVTQTKNRGPARLDIHMCDGERFIATFGFPDAPEDSKAAEMTERREGDWRVRKIGKAVGIEFTYDDGDATKHAIEKRDGDLYVDNVQWNKSKSELCPE